MYEFTPLKKEGRICTVWGCKVHNESMTNGFLIYTVYDEIFAHFLIHLEILYHIQYDFAPDPFRISFYIRQFPKNLLTVDLVLNFR
jgi:hypothetical protein